MITGQCFVTLLFLLLCVNRVEFYSEYWKFLFSDTALSLKSSAGKLVHSEPSNADPLSRESSSTFCIQAGNTGIKSCEQIRVLLIPAQFMQSQSCRTVSLWLCLCSCALVENKQILPRASTWLMSDTDIQVKFIINITIFCYCSAFPTYMLWF